jgi:hypothetical protein
MPARILPLSLKFKSFEIAEEILPGKRVEGGFCCKYARMCVCGNTLYRRPERRMAMASQSPRKPAME